MVSFKSEDGKSSVEFIKIGYDDFGEKSYGFFCNASSRGFSARLDDIWFYEEDLLKFYKSINDLISNTEKKVELKAMSEFSCMVEAKDSLGHFHLIAKFENLFYNNSAVIVVELETQALMNFLEDLRSQMNVK